MQNQYDENDFMEDGQTNWAALHQGMDLHLTMDVVELALGELRRTVNRSTEVDADLKNQTDIFLFNGQNSSEVAQLTYDQFDANNINYTFESDPKMGHMYSEKSVQRLAQFFHSHMTD